MAEYNGTWARFVQMCCEVYPDDLDLDELRTMEAFDEEQLAADALQAEQLDREAAKAKAEVAEVEVAWRTIHHDARACN
jgi:hypothetical protein